jgi:hypothetical protein
MPFDDDKAEALVQKYKQYESKWQDIGLEFHFDEIWYDRKTPKLHFQDGWHLLTPDFPAYERLMRIIEVLKAIDQELNYLEVKRARSHNKEK